MKIKFLALLILMAASVAWAQEIQKYEWTGSSRQVESTWISTSTWIVTKSTTKGYAPIFTLDEFVSSGKFCAWQGRHEWWVSTKDHGCDYYHGEECRYCHRCRKKFKVSKVEEEWEK